MKKNYKLYRTVAAITLVTALSTGIAQYKGYQATTHIPYTQEDLTNNISFSAILEEINEEEIIFTNPELKLLIEKELGTTPTKENLASIRSFSITEKLNNQDLSDLKYLPNLSSLLVFNNNVNGEDLQYNINLYGLILNCCEISNSECLPNSIHYITLDYCKSIDQEFIVPYYTKELECNGSIVNNIRLKNPSILEIFTMYTDSFIDLSNIKDCTNLKELSLTRITNVKNSQILATLPSLETVTLDEYAAIWLSLDTLEMLPVEEATKIKLSNEIKTLDNIASSIIKDNPNITPEEAAKQITTHLLAKYEYDFASVENYEIDGGEVTIYNDYPISSMMESKKGVCINYASMFTAIANRLGLETFQLFNSVHTWNAINTENGYVGYDLSYLESGPIVKIDGMDTLSLVKDSTVERMLNKGYEDMLYYYEFDINKIIDDNHIADYTPQEITDKILNIGYINDDCIARIIEDNNVKIVKLNTFTKSYLILGLLSLILCKLQDKLTKTEDEYLEDEDIIVLKK